MAPSDETLNTLAQGIAIIMQADRFCDQQVKNRVVLKFADDTELNELTRAIMTLGEETKKMDEQLQTKLHELRGMLKARWDLSVKKFGLNPVERIYTVDEGREEINLVELECVGCKGATKIRKVRQDVTAAVAQLVRDKIDTGEHLQSKGETA
jgi:mRNA-degrading endonuclease YafQ of YafQ-DinJ toxin-antitoxin module